MLSFLLAAPACAPAAVAPTSSAPGPCGALEACVEACKAGSTSACNEVGRAWELGQGVPRSGVHANTYYRLACDQGDPAGCYNAAYLLESGLAGRLDVGCALALYKHACDAGHARACLSAGQILRAGAAEVPKDPAAADAYLRKGCEAGHPGACEALEKK